MYSEPAPTDIEPDDEAPETINEGQSLKQILIVEDNSDVASFIGSQLGKDYEIHFAQNGKEGLDMARSLIPDLIISDVMMPMMDGLEFCRLLRADELVCHIPVIMVTAKVSEEDRLRGLECGVYLDIKEPEMHQMMDDIASMGGELFVMDDGSLLAPKSRAATTVFLVDGKYTINGFSF